MIQSDGTVQSRRTRVVRLTVMRCKPDSCHARFQTRGRPRCHRSGLRRHERYAPGTLCKRRIARRTAREHLERVNDRPAAQRPFLTRVFALLRSGREDLHATNGVEIFTPLVAPAGGRFVSPATLARRAAIPAMLVAGMCTLRPCNQTRKGTR